MNDSAVRMRALELADEIDECLAQAAKALGTHACVFPEFKDETVLSNRQQMLDGYQSLVRSSLDQAVTEQAPVDPILDAYQIIHGTPALWMVEVDAVEYRGGKTGRLLEALNGPIRQAEEKLQALAGLADIHEPLDTLLRRHCAERSQGEGIVEIEED